MYKKILAAAAAAISFASIAKADITDGAFGVNQIFDVQYYWSGTTLNASNFIAPYDMNFTHPTVSSGQYFKFFPSTTNPGKYGLGLYNADGTLAQVLHNYGDITALGNGAIFYIGSGFFGNVITPATGYNYGDSAAFTNMDTSVSASDISSYTWASTTPLGAGQTAGSTPQTPTVVSTAAGPNTVTTQTVPGTIIYSISEARGTPTISLSYNDGVLKGKKTFDVTRTTTQTTRTPVTVTTVTTTPITVFTTTTPSTVTTWSDGTTTTTNGTAVTTSTTTNQVVTNTTQYVDVDVQTGSETKSVASDGMKNAIAFRNNNLYTVNPLDKKDGSWIEPYAGAYRINNTMRAQGLSMGHQFTVENNTVGVGVNILKGETGTKLGAQTETNSFAGVGYILTKQDYFWYKGALGVGYADYKNVMSIPSFGLASVNKAKQINVYADNTFYSAYDYYGLRPFAGVMINNSNIAAAQSIGSPILYNTPNKGSTFYGLPYVGLRYEPIENISLEYRATKSPDFNMVHSVRATANKKIKDNIYVNLTVGADKGGNNYKSAVGMVGLVIKF